MGKYNKKQPIEAVQFFKSDWEAEYEQSSEDANLGRFTFLSKGVIRIAGHTDAEGKQHPTKYAVETGMELYDTDWIVDNKDNGNNERYGKISNAEFMKHYQVVEETKLSFENLITNVKIWSKDRNLDQADSNRQLLKLEEELGELTQGHLKRRPEQVTDSLGDMLVVMTIYCQQNGLNLHDCFSDAYNEITNRKGKTVDGVFIKAADLNQNNKG